jgi:hypothetical protein
VNASNRRTRQAYDPLGHDDQDSLLDVANIMATQMRQNGQFPTWLKLILDGLYDEFRALENPQDVASLARERRHALDNELRRHTGEGMRLSHNIG